MSTIINATTTNGVVIQPDNSGSLVLQTNSGTTALTIDTSQNVGIGITAPNTRLHVQGNTNADGSLTYNNQLTSEAAFNSSPSVGTLVSLRFNSSGSYAGMGGWSVGKENATDGNFASYLALHTRPNGGSTSERMRIDSSGATIIGKTAITFGTQGAVLNAEGAFYNTFTRSGGPSIVINRITNDGTLVEFCQDGTTEGTISVSGTTVSYNGGHLSRWSQFDNETGKPEVYRGTVLESVDAMCEWEKDGEPLSNEQATKTIVSTTPSSKAVAGVFDRYDEDDQDNPYDFYVAQSGDFVIRIAQGVTVQNGDLLESAGDGTARPQADDICRSSTIAKVTSNYVSATYEDGSYCVPCILMIG
jgi:hypothetical protein